MKDKNLAKQDWLEMIKKSWTWARLTEKEKEKFSELLEHPCSAVVIRGNYEQRWEACEALYHTFLDALGYDPLEWREGKSTSSTFYEVSYKHYGEQVQPLRSTDKNQVIRFAKSLKAGEENKEVKLFKVDITSTEMRNY
jgi:hypothetical protein